jgi:ribosomal protein S7
VKYKGILQSKLEKEKKIYLGSKLIYFFNSMIRTLRGLLNKLLEVKSLKFSIIELKKKIENLKKIKKKKKKVFKRLEEKEEYIEIYSSFYNKFFCSFIFKGMKLKAFNNMLKLKEALKFKEKADPFDVLLAALFKITPSLFLMPLKRGGETVAVPLPLNRQRQISFSVK